MSLHARRYKLKTGKVSVTWNYDFEVGKHRYRGSFGHCSKTKATARYESLKADIRAGRWQPKAMTIPTLSEFLPEYLTWYASYAAPRSLERHQDSAKSLLPVLGKLSLDRITDARVDGYLQGRAAVGRAPASLNRELGLLTHALRTAVRWGKLTTYPLKGIRKLRELPRTRILTAAEEHRLLDAAHTKLRDVIITALDTGLRESELVSLRRSSVDLRQGTLTVLNGYAKNRETRTLEMTTRVRTIIEAHLTTIRETDRQTPLLGYRQATSIKRAFRKLRDGVLLSDVRFHDLRHAFATRLLLAGVDLVKVQHMLGHKTVGMTMRYLTLTGGDTRGILSTMTQVGAPHKSPTLNLITPGPSVAAQE